MSRVRFQAKANGLLLLRGRWLKAMAVLLLILLLMLGFSALNLAFRTAAGEPFLYSDGSINLSLRSVLVEVAFTVITLFFIPPLITGQAEWYWSLTDAQPKGVGEVFGWFGSLRLYFKSVGVALNIFIRSLLWAVLICGVPVGMIIADYIYFPPSDVLNNQTLVFGLIFYFALFLLLGALFLLGYVMTRYFLTVFLLVEDNKRSVREIVRTSLNYSKGQRWELMKFFLSYILWFIQLYFVLPAFFVLPYFNSASTVFAKHLIYTRRALEKPHKEPSAT